jgi:hypothetical protein
MYTSFSHTTRRRRRRLTRAAANLRVKRDAARIAERVRPAGASTLLLSGPPLPPANASND